MLSTKEKRAFKEKTGFFAVFDGNSEVNLLRSLIIKLLRISRALQIA